MHRIDGAGATVGNLFTEGNPSLGVPATVVTDDWANDVQEEIVNVILDQGIALVKGTQTQLLDAIKSIVAFGGDSQISQAIANLQAAAADVTGAIYDKTSIKAVHLAFDLERLTDTQNEQESGWIYLRHDTNDDVWHISVQSTGDDCGVTFSVTASGQLQYTSDDLSGTNYEGTLRITSVLQAKQ